MIPLIVIRPQPGCDATVAEANTLGLEAYGVPLFAVVPVAWHAPAADSFDALLLGSTNALRHGGSQLSAYIGKPSYVVGAATAKAADAAGLVVVAIGHGGLQPVLDTIGPGHRRLLRLAGQERISLVPPGNVSMIERIVYTSTALPMPHALVARLREPAVVMLHSAEAARHFTAECDRHAIDRARLALAAIGSRVAAAAGEGWRALCTAPKADGASVLALARQMCQDRHR